MELKIYDHQGTLKATVSPSDNSVHEWGIMQDNMLKLSFMLYDYVPLEVRDYIDYAGKRYVLRERYRPEKKSTIEYNYDVTFYGPESEGRNVLVLKMADGDNEPSFTLYDEPRIHLRLIVDNLNRARGEEYWMVGQIVDAGAVNIDYELISCFDGLTKLAEALDTEWWIEANTINLTRCEFGEQLIFGYGQGLVSLTKDSNDNTPFFTRLYPLGSTRNIDRSVYGHSRLQLPAGQKYIEQNTHLGIVEHAEESAFSHIYPKRIGTVGVVRKETLKGENGDFDVYYFTDPDMAFDPNEYEIGGLVKHISFQSGPLAGQDFEANFDSKTREFELITQFPYDNMQLPGGSLIPRPGDEYILYNIRMPEEYYALAEGELREAVARYLEKYSIDVSVYKAPTDYIYLNEQGYTLRPGRRVKLVSGEYFDNSDAGEYGTRNSRITKITAKLDEPNDADIEISYAVAASKLQSIENNVGELQAAFREQARKDDMVILKTTDSSDPTDYNVLSSRRAFGEFLSKRSPDEARALINFAVGIGVASKTVNDVLRYGIEEDGELDATNQNIFSALRTQREIQEATKGFLSKNVADTARKLITFLEGIEVEGLADIQGDISVQGLAEFIGGILVQDTAHFEQGLVVEKVGRFLEELLVDGVTTLKGKLDAKESAVFWQALSSPEFVSGMLGGKGWAIRNMEHLNSAGETEVKSHAEFDDVTIRGSLRALELVISQLKGEADNYIFSGMMKVSRIDRSTRKIYLDTGDGVLYNPFRKDDCLRCQRYGGVDNGLAKQYDLIVTDAGTGGEDGEGRLDWITYRKFEGDEAAVAEGDILVRIDNLSDPDRKGIITNTSIGAYAPYIDILYGLLTDPEDAIKSRMGNLAGIYSPWFGWLKGFGAFMQNFYGIGDLRFRNGESVQTRLDMIEGLFRVDMQNKTYALTEDDNFLRNAAFTENMEYWSKENSVSLLTVAGKPLMINRNIHTLKDQVAGVVEYEGRNMLRIKASGIRQANENIRRPDPTDSALYLSFKFKCVTSGQLTCGFESNREGDEGTLPFLQEEIVAGAEFQTRTYSGIWNGEGDFVISFTGDIYIDLLSVTNRPLDDFRKEVSTRFEQTDEMIRLQGDRIVAAEGVASQVGLELNAEKENIRLWAEKTDDNAATISRLSIEIDAANDSILLNAEKHDRLAGTVSNQGIRIDAAENQLELFSEYKNTTDGTLSSLGLRMNAAEGAIGLLADFKDLTTGEVTSLGLRMDSAEGNINLTASRLNEADGKIVDIGIRMDAVEGALDFIVDFSDDTTGAVIDLALRMSAAESRIELMGEFKDSINGTVSQLGLRMDGVDSELELFSNFRDAATGTMTDLGQRMNSAEGVIETYGTRINSHDGSLISLGNRMSLAEGRIETYIEKTDQITGELVSVGTRMDAIQGSLSNYVLSDTFNGFKGDAEATLERHWSAIEQTDRSMLLAINKATGYPLYKDIKFEQGYNGISAYGYTGAVSVKRLSIYSAAYIPTSANYPASAWNTTALKQEHVGDVFRNTITGTYYEYSGSYTWVIAYPEFGYPTADQKGIIRIQKVAGDAEIGLGGFSWGNIARPAAVFEARFTAKIPAGYTLNINEGAIGDDGKVYWLTDRAGTGNWKEYRVQIYCGSEGNFTETCNFYLTYDYSTSNSITVKWYLQEGTVFDLTGYEDPITSINLTETEAKISAKHISLEGIVTVNENFKIDLDGRMHALSGTFGGYIKTPLKFPDESDAEVIGYQSIGGYLYARYSVKKDLNLMSRQIYPYYNYSSIEGTEYHLPNDEDLEGAHVIIYNEQHPPYTRSSPMTHTRVFAPTNQPIQGAPIENDPILWTPPKGIEFLSGIIELVAMPNLVYDSNQQKFVRSGISWMILSLNAASYRLLR